MPVALEGLADLFTLLAWGIALSLLYIWRFTVGALILHLADLLDKASIHAFHRTFHLAGPVSAGLRDVDAAIQHTLAEIAHGAERATVYLFHKTLAGLELFGHELWSLGYDLGGALERITHKTIPASVRAATSALAHELHAIPGQIRRETQAALRPLERSVSRVEALAHRTAIALPRELAGVRGRIGRAERTLERDAARVTRLEKEVGIAALTATVVTILGRLGLRWLRCGNVNRVGRSVCGMDASLLESLLADALLVGGALSLVELAEHMQGVVGESAGLIQRFWDAA